jgi:sulfur carrier protein
LGVPQHRDSQSLTGAFDSCYLTVNVVVNGIPREIPRDTTVAALLAELEVTQQHVAVEVNLELVPRARHAEHRLREGDRLEIVTLVGGG